MKNNNEMKTFLETVNKIDVCLGNNPSYTKKDYSIEFKNAVRTLNAALKENSAESEVLRVGIIGAMKAGKSSFLNMVFFEGKDVLPKAPTPMTAALTILTYGKKNTITIHYFNENSWNRIKELNDSYLRQLDSAYAKYIRDFRKEHDEKDVSYKKTKTPRKYYDDLNELVKKGKRELKGLVNRNAPSESTPTSPCKKNIFEKEFLAKKDQFDLSDYMIAAHELVNDVETRTGVLDKLGKVETIEVKKVQDLRKSLDEYVGENGQYHSIVDYVELTVNIKDLKGIEIVDTPGLGDPVISRHLCTMNFLEKCDAVLYFSKACPFLDKHDVDLLFNKLPERGISDIVVLASRFDSAVLNERNKMDLDTAIKKTCNVINERYKEVLSSKGWSAEALHKHKPIPISSMAYSIYNKLQSGKKVNHKEFPQDLTEDERTILEGLMAMNDSQIPSENSFWEISGLDKIAEEFRRLRDNKKDIKQLKTEEFKKAAQRTILNVLTLIIEDVTKGIKTLSVEKTEDIAARRRDMEDAIDRASSKISAIFEEESQNAKAKLRHLRDVILPDNRTSFSRCKQPDRKKIRRQVSMSSGFLGLNKTIQTIEKEFYTLETGPIKDNLKGYAARCAKLIHEDFNNLVILEQIRTSIKEAVTTAIEKYKYNEDDILVPLRLAIAKINLPDITINPTKYCNIINAMFPDGVARGNDIHSLSSLLVDELTEIQNDIGALLDKNAETIETILMEQASTFSISVRDKISESLKQLEKESKDKKRNISGRRSFLNDLRDLQKELIS